MSIHIDLLIPSFTVPLTSSSIHHPSEPLEENDLKSLAEHCSKAFGVDGSGIEIFKMVNQKKDVRIGCFIAASKLNMDVITQTMQQNKTLHELLTKSTDAVLHFQQRREQDIQQLLAKTNELTELKLACKKLKTKLKQLKTGSQQPDTQQQNDSNNNNLYKPDISRSQLLDNTHPSKFMERLMNNTSAPSHSLSASAPSSPNLSFSPETIPPGPSGIISPLDLNESAPPSQSTTSTDSVSENLRKKLLALAKEGPYYSYSSGLNISSSPPSRPLSASTRPIPPSGPRPGSHASPRMGSRVLSRATLQWEPTEANGKDEQQPHPPPPSAITSPLSMLPRSTTPKSIRVSTPRTASPRRPFLDAPLTSSFHLSTPSGVVPLPNPASSSSSPREQLIVRGKNV